MNETLNREIAETFLAVVRLGIVPDMVMPVVRTTDDVYTKTGAGVVRLWRIPGVSINPTDDEKMSSALWLSETCELVSITLLTSHPRLQVDGIRLEAEKTYFWTLTCCRDQVELNEALYKGLRRLRLESA